MRDRAMTACAIVHLWSSHLEPATRRPRCQRILNNRRQARNKEDTMICRIWHGWTTLGDADAYEALLRSEIFPWIENRHLAGFHGIQLLRRALDDSVEFVTIMWFDSMASVREFAGDDPEAAVVLPEAQALLARFDERSQHYDVQVDA